MVCEKNFCIKRNHDICSDPNLQNRMGNTALHFAVAQGNYHLVEVLLSKGASKRIKNHYAQGITPTQVSRKRELPYPDFC